MNLDGLKNQVALITGGGRGIGLAIATVLAANGARVALLDLDEKLVRESASALPGAIGVTANVTDAASLANAVSETEARLGPVDVLVNNAGVIEWVPFAEGTDAQWDRAMSINAKGVFLCCRAVYAGMKARGRGVIINLTSSAGKKGAAACPYYAASKAAVLNLTLSLASDLAPHGVRVNAVAPALIETDMFAGKDVIALSPMKRMGRPQEVADAVAFLCSANASFITGEVLDINGGFLMD
jgi:NAD(P)-dependent dehydrogenase (short-subunit alcohol dehydrogenase family)